MMHGAMSIDARLTGYEFQTTGRYMSTMKLRPYHAYNGVGNMNSKPEGAGDRACWFVGAAYGGTDDQAPRFLQDGIWENGYQDKYLDAVKSIQVRDRIAIKSSYTRKHDLPFDNRGQTVSVMAIKAIGTAKENIGDGRTVKVDWKPFDRRVSGISIPIEAPFGAFCPATGPQTL